MRIGHAGQVSGLTVLVAEASSGFEAQLIVGLLEANGIDARSSADDAGGQEPQWQLTQGVRILVAPEDESEARQIIAEAGNDSGDDAS
jgi:Putative prokaryotic signal transducing protein